MEVNKICRCCLTNKGPLLTIYDGGTTTDNDCLAAMLNQITGIKVDPDDKMPDKACLLCIRDIKEFCGFKKKCENSHRTLHQLFLSKVEVQLRSPHKNNHIKEATENEDLLIKSQKQMAPVESVEYVQMKVEDDYSQRVNIESNVGLGISMNCAKKSMASSAEKTISIPSSPITFENSSLPIEKQKMDLENNVNQQPPPPTTENMQNPYTHEYADSDTDSCDSIEFISEKPPVSEPIVVLEEFGELYDTNQKHNAEGNDSAVEYVFNHVSSPQWVPEEEIYLSIVNEDLNFEDVDRLSSDKSMEHLSYYPNKIDISAGSRHQCAICDQGFKLRNDLIYHLNAHEKPYSCLFCERFFNDYFNLEVHLTEHTTTTNRRVPSNKFSIDSPPQPKKPPVKRQTTAPKNHACDICSKRFPLPSSLINHRRIHTGERPFKCKYCDKSFVQKSTRYYHEKTHTGEKRYKCQFCDKMFTQSGSRTSHERTHTGEKPHKCQYCQRGFIQHSIKVRHEETHKRSSVTDGGQFKCKFCAEVFVTIENRLAHEIVHSAEAPHKCQYCNMGFYELNDKAKHEATHRSVINCPQCDIKFTSPSEVLEHFKTQHT